MPMLRTNKCDVCGIAETESSYGIGWQGWSILNGIAAEKPKEGEPLTNENMSMTLCPQHTSELADILTKMQEENE